MTTVVTNSLLKDLKRCPRLAYFRHQRGWQAENPSMPLSFGRAFGNAAGKWFMTKSLEKALEVWENEFIPDSPGATKADTWGNGVAALTYIASECSAITGKVELEEEWEEPLSVAKPLIYQGHIDIVLKQSDGTVQVLELKTMRERAWATSGPKKYALDDQQLGYTWLGRKKYGENFKGVVTIVSMIGADNIAVVPCEPSDLQLESWRHNTLYWAQVWENMQGHPGGCNFDSCGMYASTCFAKELCESGANPALLRPPEGWKEPE